MQYGQENRLFYAWVPSIAIAVVIALMLPGTGSVLLAYMLVAATWLVGRGFNASVDSKVARAQVSVAVIQCGYEWFVWKAILPTVYAGGFHLNPFTAASLIGLVLLILATALSSIVLGVYVAYAVVNQVQAAQRHNEALQRQG